MLSHKIIVHQLPPPPEVQVHVSNIRDYRHRSTNGFAGDVRNQTDLDAYLARTAIAKDTFVISKNWQMDAKLQLFRIHYVLDVETKYNKVYYYELGKPKCFFLAQLDNGTPSKWQRWDSGKDYRVVTNEEYKAIIEPNHDFIQNYIKELRAEHEARLQRLALPLDAEGKFDPVPDAF